MGPFPIPTDTLHVEGRVFFGDRSEPLDGGRIAVDAITLLNGSALVAGETHMDRELATDSSFEFELELGALRLGSAVRIDVVDSASRLRLRRILPLAARFELEVSDRTMLRGHWIGAELLDETQSNVYAKLPDADHGSTRFAGAASLVRGAFAIECCAAELPSEFDIELEARGLDEHRTVPTSALMSAAGAELTLDLVRLDCRVEHEDGTPFLKALVRVAPIDASDPQEIRELPVDPRGEARFWLPRRRFESVAYSSGFATRAEEIDLTRSGGADRRTYVLRWVPENVDVRGRVRFDDGAPAVGVEVASRPITSKADLYVSPALAVRTDEHGEFELIVHDRGPLRVVARSDDYGESDEFEVSNGSRPLELTLKRAGTLLVRPNANETPFGGPFDYALEQQGAIVERGASNSMPLLFRHIAPGSYRVCVQTHMPPLRGWCALELRANEANVTEVNLEPTAEAGGQLLHADGRPFAHVKVFCVDLRAPEGFLEPWGTAMTDERGEFQIVSGRGPVDFEIEFVPPGHRTLRAKVHDGSWRLLMTDD